MGLGLLHSQVSPCLPCPCPLAFLSCAVETMEGVKGAPREACGPQDRLRPHGLSRSPRTKGCGAWASGWSWGLGSCLSSWVNGSSRQHFLPLHSLLLSGKTRQSELLALRLGLGPPPLPRPLQGSLWLAGHSEFPGVKGEWGVG
jgi:hypothetical protein